MSARSRLSLIVAIVIAVTATLSIAQTPPTRLRGTIERVEGRQLALQLDDGSTATLVFSTEPSVIAVVKATLTDIQPNTYIGSAGKPQPDGTQRALEVRIFPEEMRGTGEGFRPWPGGKTMTNGAIDGPVTVVESDSSFSVKFRNRDGSIKIVVPPGTPIFRYVKGSTDEIKPGVKFTVNAATVQPDDRYATQRINIGRDGVAPP